MFDVIKFVNDVFHGIIDKAGKPYIEHCIAVSDKAVAMADDFMKLDYETVNVIRDAGYLHDIIEDTNVTYDDLAKYGISQDVIDIVRLLTHEKSVPYDKYIDSIIASNNVCAAIIKAADMLHNMDITRYPDNMKNDEIVLRRQAKYQRNFTKLAFHLLDMKCKKLNGEL